MPDWFEDISGVLERKCEALQAYSHELRDWPFHLVQKKGLAASCPLAGSNCRVDAAEAFVPGRHIA